MTANHPLVLGFLLVLSTSAPAATQQAASDEGRYTSEEAERGAEIYEESCASCHLPDLAGSFEAPELAGPSFRSAWGDRSVVELVDVVRTTMPPQAVGSLSLQEASAVTAYILRENGIPAGGSPISAAFTET
ncbi:MAG: cytochrome c, partial [Longimicrobiales bacterium]|nr:cytochrome c [Longimicrobiales bacterium]